MIRVLCLYITLVISFVPLGIYQVRYEQNCKYTNLIFSTIFHSSLMFSYIFTIIQIRLEQSDSDKVPRLTPCSEKGIFVLAKILIIIHRTKPIFSHEQ